MILYDDIRQAPTSGCPTHLATLKADGSPQASVVRVRTNFPLDNAPPGYITHIEVESIHGIRPRQKARL